MLTTAEVADLIGGGTTDAWVRERCAAGDIPAFKIGRQWRIDQDELIAWLECRRFEAAPLPSFEFARQAPSARGSVDDLLARRAKRNSTTPADNSSS